MVQNSKLPEIKYRLHSLSSLTENISNYPQIYSHKFIFHFFIFHYFFMTPSPDSLPENTRTDYPPIVFPSVEIGKSIIPEYIFDVASMNPAQPKDTASYSEYWNRAWLDWFNSAYWEQVASGKTKKIIRLNRPHDGQVVLIEWDWITAGDGVRKEHLPWKWALSATITSNTFTYLNSAWIDTHFIRQVWENMILAEECSMIPVECVFRFVNTGSYAKRTNLKEWEVLDTPIIELFYKNDVVDTQWNVISDPLIMLGDDGNILIDNSWRLRLSYPGNPDAKKWHKAGSFKAGEEITYNIVTGPSPDGGKTQGKNIEDADYLDDVRRIQDYSEDLKGETLKVGLALKEFNTQTELDLLDGKIEFWTDKDGKLKVSDVVDWDSCRIRSVLIVEWSDGKLYLTKAVWKMDKADREFFEETRMKEMFRKYIDKLPNQDPKGKISVEEGNGIPFLVYTSTIDPLFEKQDFTCVRWVDNIKYSISFEKAQGFFWENLITSAYDELPILGRDASFKQIIIARWLDKQWFREGETWEKTLIKYRELAQRSQQALANRVSQAQATAQNIVAGI